MKKFWIIITVIAMSLWIAGCKKEEAQPPAEETIVEEIKEPVKEEIIETPTGKAAEEAEGLGEPEEGKTPAPAEKEAK
ncbi:MAG: hypothetical protein JSU92_05020 [Deltaproteobacteria bacterium]|nr:MAG: hypothetical protein JSU92_05020 [Deltaproteobacteria bacterium]